MVFYPKTAVQEAIKTPMAPLSLSLLPRRQRFVVRFGVLTLILFAVSIFFSSTFGDWITSLLFALFGEPIPKERQALIYPPPEYQFTRDYEHNLPQHSLDLSFPEGRTGRYVKFSNQIRYLGWNNCLNEVLMNAHLAYESNRSYVFQDYYWKTEYFPWVVPDWPPPQTPLNALMSGPTAGGPWEKGDHAPRSISEAWFDIVCPANERRLIDTQDIKPAVSDAPGDVVFDHWKKILLEAPDRCIEIIPASRSIDGFPQTFDLWLWGSGRMLSMWDRFLNSPTSRLLRPSPIVEAAVKRNEFQTKPYQRLVAVHIRRGDYNGACLSLANWNSTYYSWNALETLPDKFIPPPGGTPGENTPENIEFYMEHCMPSMEAAVRRIEDVRTQYVAAGMKYWRVLDTVYILTNDDSEWLAAFKDALAAAGWKKVLTSHDMVLNQEQIAVGMAVDMDIARRAAVFIGNGWSSMTSNVVHRRLADGKEPISIRFW